MLAVGGMCPAVEPAVKSFAGKSGCFAFTADAKERAEELAEPARAEDKIGQGRHGAAEAAKSGYLADEPLQRREAVTPGAGVEEFSLEQREVDVGRALVDTGASGQAIGERKVQFLGAQGIVA